ncbi:hypothetical protein C943_03428 [Mariniradius saccharolyticus AK6]|uniref:DUF4843 domain-containing protein n=1 Tax=Mariniradius saccharolyticus AK6 TaxID=1239962 RepID=M7YC42_9BACT|nr:hypothetical protein [Mariniradius saccharolyticus]EMS34741.1 hypothetical protein C943_03428 [Mariniradius saccharolyticus AK6]
MKNSLIFAMLLAFTFLSCSETDEAPETTTFPEDVMFAKVKIDGQDYEYSYKLLENYLTVDEGRPRFGLLVPTRGQNFVINQYGSLVIEIMYDCNASPGKNACIQIRIDGQNPTGKSTDPFVAGIIPGSTPRAFFRIRKSNVDVPPPFELTFVNYSPLKRTIEGTFKGQAELTDASQPVVRIIDVEGSFRGGTILD